MKICLRNKLTLQSRDQSIATNIYCVKPNITQSRKAFFTGLFLNLIHSGRITQPKMQLMVYKKNSSKNRSDRRGPMEGDG